MRITTSFKSIVVCCFIITFIYAEPTKKITTSSSPEKDLNDSKNNLKVIEKKIEKIIDEKNSLEKAEKQEQKNKQIIEQQLVKNNQESRKINYGIKYSDDYIRSLEKDLEDKKNNIENKKMKLEAELSELLILSIRKYNKDPFTFLDKSDEYRERLRIACRREIDSIRMETILHDQLEAQLSELGKYNFRAKINKEKVSREITQSTTDLNNKISSLNKINKSKQVADSELKKLLESQKKINDMIKNLQKKMAEQKKRVTKSDFKFTGEGTYPWPVNGKILRPFIPDKESGTFNPGIDIGCPEGTEVKPIADGIILFANTFAGYGNMIIVEHNENLCSLYTFLQEIYVPAGQKVNTNTVIGLSGTIDTIDEPGVHLEIRQNSQNTQSAEPIDPGKWLKNTP